MSGRSSMTSPLDLVDFSFDPSHILGVKAWLTDVKIFFDSHSEAVESPLDAGLDLADVLEAISVAYAIKLIPNLAHMSVNIRNKVVMLLQQLAFVFEPTLEFDTQFRAAISDVISMLSSQYHASVHKLFATIGQHLSIMTIAIVAGNMLFILWLT